MSSILLLATNCNHKKIIYFSCFCFIRSVVTRSFAAAVVCAFPSSSSSSPILEPEEEFLREKKRSSHIIDGILTD